MYNPEAIFFTENDLAIEEFEDTVELLDEASLSELTEEELIEEIEWADNESENFDIESLLEEEEIFSEDESFSEDELFDEAVEAGTVESTPRFLPEQIPLINLVNEVNRETSFMNESEAAQYMENRMMEFLPALAAALPTIISLAPHAISAIGSIGSLLKKDPAPKPAPAQVKTKPVTTVQTPAPPVTTPVPTPANTGITDPSQMLKVLTDLIQSPKIFEMLSGMLAGKLQGLTTNNGQPISGANVLGVISSLAGSLAGGLAKESSASVFPEYVFSQEGTFVIDPHNAIQEAELILDLIN